MKSLSKIFINLLLAVPLFLCVLSFSTKSYSDSPVSGAGQELRLFKPALDNKGHVTVNGARVLPHLGFSLGLVLDYSQDLFYAVEAEGDAYDKSSVEHYLHGVFHFNLGLVNWLVLGVQLPVAVVSGTVYSPPSDGERREFSSQGLGDVSLHIKSRIWNDINRRWGIAAYVRNQFGSGNERHFYGEPGVAALTGGLVFEAFPVWWFRADLDIAVRHAFETGDSYANEIDDPGKPLYLKGGTQLAYGLGFSFAVVEETIDLMFEYIGGTTLNDSAFTKTYHPMEAVFGMKVFVEKNSYLMFGGGPGIPTDGYSTPLYRVFLGFVFEPSIGDRDGDGLPDDEDACPDEPEDKDRFQDSDGCPDPDNDLDGVLDVDDYCPLVPEDRDGEDDEDGCPEEPQDRDGDGIKNEDDNCPDEPEDKDGFEDEDGCPDIDNDNDRILDMDDQCPNEPEVYNAVEDEDGCPDEGVIALVENEVMILEKIQFEYNSAEIKKESYPILDAVVIVLKSNTQIQYIEVQGHADERGGDAYNLRLTGERAHSVMKYLLENGIERERLRSAGYGERCPLDPNHNEEAWEKNRRVEFKILRTDMGPTGVEVACPAAEDLVPGD